MIADRLLGLAALLACLSFGPLRAQEKVEEPLTVEQRVYRDAYRAAMSDSVISPD